MEKPGLKSEMQWAHWTARVPQAHIQAYPKSNSSCGHHCKSSLLAPELPPVISKIPQGPVHHMQGMTHSDLNHTRASKVSRWAGKDQCYRFFPNKQMLRSGQIIKEMRYDSNHVHYWYQNQDVSLWLLRGYDALTREEAWWQSTAVLAGGFASAMALTSLNCQKVSPHFWEGMFAIYFPLLTELLKYTKLG